MTKSNEVNAEAILAQIQVSLANEAVKHAERFELWDRLHLLAELQYEPAMAVFVTGLSDSNSSWRLAHLCNLGFHYPVVALRPYLGKLYALLREDPDEDVRRSTASIIGRVSNWPDAALLQALEDDPNAAVREAAFEALVQQLGVPLRDLRVLRHELGLKGKVISTETLKWIAKQRGEQLD